MTVCSILFWIVFGFVVGAFARLVLPGHDPDGVVVIPVE